MPTAVSTAVVVRAITDRRAVVLRFLAVMESPRGLATRSLR
jgi:hypothetical protein